MHLLPVLYLASEETSGELDIVPGNPVQRVRGGPTIHHPAALNQDGVREELPDLWARLVYSHDDSHRESVMSESCVGAAFSER